MAIELLLNFDEIVTAGSIDDLLELYKSKGQTFKNNRRFLKRIQKDWKSERRRIIRESREGIKKGLPLPTQPKNIDLIVDGINYSLYGVVHDPISGVYYKAIVWYTVENSDNWLIEQGLIDFFPGMSNGIEMIDWSIDHESAFKSGLISGLCSPKDIAINAIKYLLPRKKSKKSCTDNDVTSDIPQDKIINYYILSSYLLRNPELLPKKGPTVAESEHLFTLHYPLETWHRKLPAYVDIELRNKSGKKLTRSQKRSAYQAEFLRQWPSEGNKHILTGAAHSWEIKYFLQQGVKDNKIKDMASEHIELLQRNPDAYNSLRLQRTTDYRKDFSKGKHLGRRVYPISAGALIGFLISRIL